MTHKMILNVDSYNRTYDKISLVTRRVSLNLNIENKNLAVRLKSIEVKA